MAKLRYGNANISELNQYYGGGLKYTKVDANGIPLNNYDDPMYAVQISVTPTTLTSNTVYWAFQAGYNTTIEILQFYIQNSFHGTPAATTSNIQILRLLNGIFTPTIIPSIWNPCNAPPSRAAVAQTNAALTITNPQYETNGGVVLGISNQIGAGVEWDMQSEPRGWIITAGQGMVLRATGAIVSGYTMKGYCLYRETSRV